MSRPVFPQVQGRIIAIWGICAVLAAAAGPFGTYETGDFSYRLAYWGAVIVVSSLIARVCHVLVNKVLGRRHPVLTDFTMVGLMVLLFTPVLWVLTDRLFLVSGLDASNYPTLALYVALVTAAICIARRVLPGFEPVGYIGDAGSDWNDRPRLSCQSCACRGAIITSRW